MKTANISIAIVLAATILAVASSAAFINAQDKQGTQSFSGSLSGKNESPPTESNSTGTSDFQVNDNNSMISYSINVTGIKKITQSNIRNGSQGENGDILIVLSKSKSAKGEDRPPKISFSGNISKDDLRGSLKGKELSELVTIMNKGNAYVNIQTEKYPKGAIRAQIASSEPAATINEALTPSSTATTGNETNAPPPTSMELPPSANMSTNNATTTGNETNAPPPTSMELPPSANMSTTLGNATSANATTSKVSEFPSNQSTSAPDVDIDESMR